MLAVGTVADDGYRWLEDRKEYRHSVAVNWDTSYAKEIPAQGAWGTATVQKLTPELQAMIFGDKAPSKKASESPQVSPAEPIFADIEAALERKGQVILYGPPGTGKTYVARRFAVWWLSKRLKLPAVSKLLPSDPNFRERERQLTGTAAGSQRCWWVVANRRQWNFDQLFKDGSVLYRQGRLQRNYPKVRVGDLVIGYHATPDKKIAAIARVSKALHIDPASEEPKIELVPVAKVPNGLEWSEIQDDPVLKHSEPVRYPHPGDSVCPHGRRGGPSPAAALRAKP